jgi:hypothetical protein
MSAAILPATNTKLYSGFSPRMIPGSSLWLDAADRSTLTLSGSNVTQWRDKSGLTNTATSTAGPTQSTYNGYPVVRFDGSSQFMVSANTVPLTTHTFIALHRPEVITEDERGNASLFRYQGPTNNIPYIVFPFSLGPSNQRYVTSQGSGLDTGSSTLFENSVTTAFNIIIAVIQSGSQQIFRNGVLQSSTTVALTGGTSARLALGAYVSSTVSGGFYQGSLGEMIVYPFALTTSHRQQIEGYLADKWGLKASIPATHPFKIAPLISRPFGPLDVPGCALWLDAADRSTLTLSGSNVTQWNDKSSSGNFVHQPTTSLQGTYANNVVVLGSNRFYFGGPIEVNGLTTMSIFAVVNNITSTTPDPPTSGLNLSFIKWAETGAWGTVEMQAWPTRVDWRFGTGQTGNRHWHFFPSSVGSAYNVLMTTVNGGNGAVFQNGNQIGTYTGANAAIANTGNSFRIGSDNTNNIGEILVYTQSVSTAQRQQIEGYLANKWGIRASVPTAHPFKLFPPLVVRAFSPYDIAGGSLWLDAADRSTLTLSGSNVTQWNDKTGNGKHATAVNNPVWNSTSTRVEFNGTPMYMINTSYTLNLSQRSMFLVVEQRSYADYRGILSMIPNPSNQSDYNTTNGMAIETQNSVRFGIGLNTAVQYISYVGTQSIPKGIYNDNMTGTQGSSFLNGANVSNVVTVGAPGTCLGYLVGNRWGGSLSNFGNSFNGFIYEILIYDTLITTPQRQQVEGYLAHKWGLVGSLPATHPYKTIKP